MITILIRKVRSDDTSDLVDDESDDSAEMWPGRFYLFIALNFKHAADRFFPVAFSNREQQVFREENKYKYHKFIIHESSLCSKSSPFFGASLNGKSKGGLSQEMILEDVDPRVFALLVQLLYANPTVLGEASSIDKLMGYEYVVLFVNDIYLTL